MDATVPRKSDIFDKIGQRSSKENDETRAKSPVYDGGRFTSKSPRTKESSDDISEKLTRSSDRRESRRERNPLSLRNSFDDDKHDDISKRKTINKNEETERFEFGVSKPRKVRDEDNSRQTGLRQGSGTLEGEKRTSIISDKRKSSNSKYEFGGDISPGRSKTPEKRSPNNSRSHSPGRSKTPDKQKSPSNSRSHSPRSKHEDHFTTKNTGKFKSEISSETSSSSTKTEKSRDEYIKPSDGRKSPRRKSNDSDKSRKKMLYEFGTSVDMDDDDDDVLDNTAYSSPYTSKMETEKDDNKSIKKSLSKSRSFKSSELTEPSEGRLPRSLSRTSQSKDKEDGLTKSKLVDVPSSKPYNSEDEDKPAPKKNSKSPVYIDELNSVLAKQRRKLKLSDDSDDDNKTEKRRKASRSRADDKIDKNDKNEDKYIDKDDKTKRKNSLIKSKEKTLEKKEKSSFRRKSEDNVEDIFGMDANNNHIGPEDKNFLNMFKDKSLLKKQKKLKEKNKDGKKRKSSTSSSDEAKNEIENEGSKSKIEDHSVKELSFSELMASRKKNLQQEKVKSKEKDVNLSRKNSKDSLRKDVSEEDIDLSRKSSKGSLRKDVPEEIDKPVNDSDLLDDIFKENSSPKKKPLQRQLSVKSSPDEDAKETRRVESKSITESPEKLGRKSRSMSINEKTNAREVKAEEVDVPSLKLSGATSVENLSARKTPTKEKTNLSKQRSLSANNLSHPSSSPKKDKVLKKASSSQKLSSTRNDATFTVPTNSNDLKEIIYHQWLEKKKVQTKEEIKAKMLAQKRAAKQAEADANERKVTAQKIYDAWNDSKTDKIITEKEMTKKAKQAEKEKIEEALQRKKDAEKYFEAWKREKDEKIKKMIVQKKKEEKQKDKEQFNLKRQTSEEALKAFESWKIQKAKEIAEMKKKEEEEKAKAGEEKVLAFEKKQEALRVYEQWKSVKKSPRAQSQSPQLMQRSWLPAGRNLNNSIPEKIQPVIIRNRNVSR